MPSTASIAPDNKDRPSIVGPDTPGPPYPLSIQSKVVPGFGRGSSELNCPTANIEEAAFEKLNLSTTGVYFGWASVHANTDKQDREFHLSEKQEQSAAERNVVPNFGHDLGPDDGVIYPMVMSVGYNPFFKNKKQVGEIHIIHEYAGPFYGAHIKFTILGYIRPEYDYVSKEALMQDIQTDIQVALKSLNRPGYLKHKHAVECK